MSDAVLFLRKAEVMRLHAESLARFGGTPGVRDEGGLESALAAPENRHYYESASLAVCAATYAYHLSQAHPFIDGNKRIAAAAAEVFLGINGARLRATNREIVELFLGIAAGAVTRDETEAWFVDRT